MHNVRLRKIATTLLFTIIPPDHAAVNNYCICYVSFAQSAFDKSHKRIYRSLFILTLADQCDLIPAFNTGTQNTQNTFGIRCTSGILKCYGRFVFYCLAAQKPCGTKMKP